MEMNDYQWQLAHSIAIELVKKQYNLDSSKKSGIRGEFEKIIAYLRYGKQENLSISLVDYLETLVRQGKSIGHSGKTPEYYRAIQETCKPHAKYLESNLTDTLQIFGWVKRLMQYYLEAVPIEDLTALETDPIPEPTSQRQAEIKKTTANQKFEVGQEVEAKITTIKGNQVTYEILETIKLTEKEPKHAGSLQEGQIVTVTIAALKDDGNIKKVKYKP
jgi:hypothetical protein